MSELAERELRKCNLQAVILALEGSHWKKLLCHIPLTLDSDNFVPKYNSDHISYVFIRLNRKLYLIGFFIF